jgi:hypothetical protein
MAPDAAAHSVNEALAPQLLHTINSFHFAKSSTPFSPHSDLWDGDLKKSCKKFCIEILQKLTQSQSRLRPCP